MNLNNGGAVVNILYVNYSRNEVFRNQSVPYYFKLARLTVLFYGLYTVCIYTVDALLGGVKGLFTNTGCSKTSFLQSLRSLRRGSLTM